MNKLHELNQHGQAVWLDFIRRSLLTSGELHHLVEQGVRGMTSNPSIFKAAIADSADYDEAIQELVAQGYSVYEIDEALALEDIGQAADTLRPVYDEDRRSGRLYQPGGQPGPGPRHRRDD